MSTLCSVVSAASAQLSALLSSLAPREIYYIGGPEPLPAPLTPAEEQALLARLDTDGAAVRTTLIEHASSSLSPGSSTTPASCWRISFPSARSA